MVLDKHCCDFINNSIKDFDFSNTETDGIGGSGGCGESNIIIKCQTIAEEGSFENENLKIFADRIFKLSRSSVKIEIIPSNKVIKNEELLDSINSNNSEINAVFGWSHYWYNKSKEPATLLFSSPPAGAGGYFDYMGFHTWMQYGGGDKLYDNLLTNMKYSNVKSMIIASGGNNVLKPLPDELLEIKNNNKNNDNLEQLKQNIANTEFYISKPIYNKLSKYQKACIDTVKNELLINSYLLTMKNNNIILNDGSLNLSEYANKISKKLTEISNKNSFFRRVLESQKKYQKYLKYWNECIITNYELLNSQIQN